MGGEDKPYQSALESTKKSIEEIVTEIGYDDSTSFRKLFKRYTGVSPKSYRDKFQGMWM